MATKNRNHKKQDHKKDHQKDDHENQDHKNKDTPPDLPRIAPLPSEPPASVKPALPLTPTPLVLTTRPCVKVQWLWVGWWGSICPQCYRYEVCFCTQQKHRKDPERQTRKTQDEPQWIVAQRRLSARTIPGFS